MRTTQAWRQAARLSKIAAAVGLLTAAQVAPAGAGPITLTATAQSTPNESCTGGTGASQTSTTLAVAHYTCTAGASTIGADASAAPGSLGVASTGQHGGGSIPLAQYGQAFYTDTVTFTRLDGSLPDTLAVSLTVDLDGTMGKTPGGAANLMGRVDLLNVFGASFVINLDLPFESHGFIVTGATGPETVDLRLTTITGTAFINQAYTLEMRMTGQTYVNFGGSATVDFLHTFGFPSDRPVFNLPDGYTANAGDYLVNNRFVGGATAPPAAVPEPGTLTLVGLTILGLGIARRRRVA